MEIDGSTVLDAKALECSLHQLVKVLYEMQSGASYNNASFVDQVGECIESVSEALRNSGGLCLCQN